MRKFLIIGATALLSGCGTLSFPTQTQIQSDIALVQQAAQAICKFVPDVATLTAIFAANPIVSSVQAIAQGICSAITTPAAVRGTYPTYLGVRLRGHFVK